MRIRFLRRHVVQQHDGKGPVYEAGEAYDFEGRAAESYARKYMRLGHAVEVSAAEMAAAEAEAAAAREAEAKRAAEAAERDRIAAETAAREAAERAAAEEKAAAEAAERQAADAEAVKRHAGVVIPEDWRELAWPELRSLAADLSEAAIRSKADAEAAIEAELARRAAASA